jgi:regulator of PEP synthase PpsR (kinase-PPPase family)
VVQNSVKNETRHLHLHLVSDATGETLITVARAAYAQYPSVTVVEHLHAMTRAPRQVERILAAIEREPGIVLFTLVDRTIADPLEAGCRAIAVPCFSVLDPVLQVFQSYLGASSEGRAGAQHALDGDYFRRIEALTFAMMHDDGQLPDELDLAEIVIIGVSRTSKTPTSIYLANRGVRTANIPIVPGVALPAQLETARGPLIVGLVATPDRIVQMRENRVLALTSFSGDDPYIDRAAVANEIAATRKICARHGWPVIDVSRRSIEETATAILALRRDVSGAPDAAARS